MLLQAASFALLAAISPTALLVMAVYLGSASPRRTASFYVAGALVMTAVTAAITLVVIRTSGLNLPSRREPRYGLRLGLGVLALAAAGWIWRRARSGPDATGPDEAGRDEAGRDKGAPEQPGPGRPQRTGLMNRLLADPKPATAFTAGLVLFAPSITFLAAVQVIATARAGTALTAVALVVVVTVSIIIVWLPLAAYHFAPDQTTRVLKALNGWLRAYGKTVAVGALAAGGAILMINGILGVM